MLPSGAVGKTHNPFGALAERLPPVDRPLYRITGGLQITNDYISKECWGNVNLILTRYLRDVTYIKRLLNNNSLTLFHF